MGRPRKTGHELPKRVYLCHGAYYYVPKDGKRRWLARTFPDAMAAWSKLVDRPQDSRTMDKLFNRYVIEVLPSKADATQKVNLREFIALRTAFGAMRPEEVDAGAAYGYQEKRSKAAPTRANRELALLCHVMTKAVRWGVIPFNPLYRLEKNPETPRNREVAPKEVLAWYRVAGPVLAAYTCLKLLMGLRKGDMLRLRVEWWSKEGLYAEIGKTKKRMLFERTPALEHAVERCLRRRPCPESMFIFCTRDRGEVYTESGFDSIWQRRMVAFAAAGHLRFTEHDLRSKAGDDAEEAGRAGHKLLGNTEAQFRKAYQRRTQKVRPVR